MTTPLLRPSELVEIFSYNFSVTGIAFAFAGALSNTPISNVSRVLQAVGLLMTFIGVLSWRFRSSVRDRVDAMVEERAEGSSQ